MVAGSDAAKEKAQQCVKEKYGIENFILNVSRIEPRKNHLLLLNTFLELKLYNQGIALVFIGKRSIKTPALEAKVRSLTDKERKYFHWIEQVDQQELELFYRASRLFVYPSKAEGFGIPPLEAAVFQTSVLCSNATAMKDFTFFEPFSFDPENNIEFKKELKAMIHTPSSPAQLHSIAEEVMEKYSWQKSAATLYKLLKENHKQ